MKMRLLILALLTFSLAFEAPSYANERIVIVVSADNPVNKMTHSEVVDLFMGKYVAFPDGSKAVVTDLSGDQILKKDFYQKLVGRSLASINSYWSRLRFTGRQRTPIEQSSEESVIAFIENNNAAVGYLRASKVSKQLKVVYEFNE